VMDKLALHRATHPKLCVEPREPEKLTVNYIGKYLSEASNGRPTCKAGTACIAYNFCPHPNSEVSGRGLILSAFYLPSEEFAFETFHATAVNKTIPEMGRLCYICQLYMASQIIVGEKMSDAVSDGQRILASEIPFHHIVGIHGEYREDAVYPLGTSDSNTPRYPIRTFNSADYLPVERNQYTGKLGYAEDPRHFF